MPLNLPTRRLASSLLILGLLMQMSYFLQPLWVHTLVPGLSICVRLAEGILPGRHADAVSHSHSAGSHHQGQPPANVSSIPLSHGMEAVSHASDLRVVTGQSHLPASVDDGTDKTTASVRELQEQVPHHHQPQAQAPPQSDSDQHASHGGYCLFCLLLGQSVLPPLALERLFQVAAVLFCCLLSGRYLALYARKALKRLPLYWLPQPHAPPSFLNQSNRV